MGTVPLNNITTTHWYCRRIAASYLSSGLKGILIRLTILTKLGHWFQYDHARTMYAAMEAIWSAANLCFPENSDTYDNKVEKFTTAKRNGRYKTVRTAGISPSYCFFICIENETLHSQNKFGCIVNLPKLVRCGSPVLPKLSGVSAQINRWTRYPQKANDKQLCFESFLRVRSMPFF